MSSLNSKEDSTLLELKNGNTSQSEGNLHDPTLNALYGSQLFKNQFLQSWKFGEPFQFKTPTAFEELIFTKKPFSCARLPNILSDDAFLHKVAEELNQLHFDEKQNDLYKFELSDDLKGVDFSYIKMLCDFFKSKLKPWMENITGIKLTENVSLSCSKYKYTDTLLCHDDTLEGRRIAFILYLVPPWKESDGGSLDLFDVDEHSRPWNISKRIYPLWNSFAFFEVSSISFHQVSEILAKDKTRLSINGWFYGDPIDCPLVPVPHPLTYLLPGDVEEEEVYNWINPMYLDDARHTEIRKRFSRLSEIALDNFLISNKYNQLATCLASDECQWTWTGPPNRKHYEILHRQKAPKIVQDFLKVLHSEAIFLIIAEMTGLQLHRCASTTEDSDEADVFDEEQGDLEEEDGIDEEDLFDEEQGELEEEDGIDEEVELDAVPSTSSGEKKVRDTLKRKATGQSHSLTSKKLRMNSKLVTHSFNDGWESDVEKEHLESLRKRQSTDDPSTAECTSQIIRWSPGTYSLMRDDDNLGCSEFILDASFYCNADHCSAASGGTKHYTAKDDPEEILSIIPKSNCLALVYKDEQTYQFTRHLNHKYQSSHQEINVQFREINMDSMSSS